MKSKYIKLLYMLLLAVNAVCIYACKKGEPYQDPVATGGAKPGVVTNVKVKNLNGAAVITYDLPGDQDLLYVVADYNIRPGVSREIKTSYFFDTIRVEGFHASQEYSVTLKAVSRSNKESDPVTVTVHPDTPYFQLISKSLKLMHDFGGINIQAVNKAQSAVALNTLTIDPVTKSFAIANEHYTSLQTINYSLRGYKPQPTKFGVFVSDQFGNKSDTTIVTLTPDFETVLAKNKFFNYPMASDAFIGYGGVVPNIFDGNTTEDNGANAWQTTIGSSPKLMQCTFGLGASYKLTHFLMYFRNYGGNNPKDFTIFGSSADNPGDATTPGGAIQGTQYGDWVSLGSFRVPDPPSGLPQGQTNAGDQAYVNNGIDFSMPTNNPNVKYIRIVVKDTWSGLDYTIIREVTFSGVPQ
ncbi:DUF4959 domain-containing protein [Mucilaginibacter pocheonensis]|uniref:DUF4959 domain-containing protein n=1 Tax=Mucilaginibacter pocheonensis TaxID=398050 RepID=A0ABU1TEE1_9SPHI|nr:DUF4959 domain-containing protein [Mucilaginibacter pocheonensis]MDR6943747.1 hypothetical protein [Mucilaginibacter pocheonensis]